MAKLNYHHLYYFWHVAHSGHLTRSAEQLHLSQSALSAQIKQLEQQMQVQLFERQGRSLVLTDLGRQALLYADDIFSKGSELESLLLSGETSGQRVLRLGVLSTLSRNFVEGFVRPLLSQQQARYVIQTYDQAGLLNALVNHQVDLGLSNLEVRGTDKQLWQSQLLAQQAVVLVGPKDKSLEQALSSGLILPTQDHPIRAAFEAYASWQSWPQHILAEANDMAMLRLLARDSGALAVLPKVVVQDELACGQLQCYQSLPNCHENFYALSVRREFSHPLLASLLAGH